MAYVGHMTVSYVLEVGHKCFVKNGLLIPKTGFILKMCNLETETEFSC